MQNTSKIRASDFAFGTILDGRTYGILGRVGFNGQERDDEISGVGNSNTAEFWQYDTRLGRRWNIDPVNMPWLSSYSAFDNSPVLNSDILGNTFEGQTSKDNAKAAKTEAIDRKSGLEKRRDELNGTNGIAGEIQQLKEQIAAAPKKEKKELNNQLNLKTAEEEYVQQSLKIVDRTISEINEMEISPQKFTLLESNEVSSGGGTYYDKSTNTVAMFYNPKSKAADKHELKHGYQFLKGNISFSPNVTKTIGGKIYQEGGVLFDQTDEVEAYKVSYAFDPTKPTLKLLDFDKINLDYIQGMELYNNLPDFQIDIGNISNMAKKFPKQLDPTGDINITTVP